MPTPRTPRDVLNLRGSWRGKAREDEPQPQRGKPVKPDWLKGEASDTWDILVGLLDDMGVLTVADGQIVSRYADLFARWRECCRVLVGMANHTTDGGMVRPRPESVLYAKLIDALRKLEAEMGLTPSARSKLSVKSKGNPDPLKHLRGKSENAG